MKLDYVKFSATFVILYLASSAESAPTDCVVQQSNCYANCPSVMEAPTCNYDCTLAAKLCLDQYKTNPQGDVTNQSNGSSKKQPLSIHHLISLVVLGLTLG